MDAHDICAGGAVEQGVEGRPVGDRVGTVSHGLDLTIRTCDRPRIEVISHDDDRGRNLAGGDEVVDPEGEASPFR